MAIVKGAKKGKGEARKPVVAPDSAQSKTYIKILYGLGEGEIEGLANGNQSIFLEGTPLQDANGNLNYSNVKLDFRKGTNDQDYIEGFPSVESETAVDVELKSGAPWVRAFNNIDLDAVRIRLKWGPLRQQDSSTGDVSGITIEYAIDIQTDGGAWTEVLKTKISDKTSANYERAHRIDLPKADSGWLIRVRRITPNSTSEFVSDKMYVEAFTEVVDAKLRYPNTALLGLQYDAETFGNVAKLAVDLKGRLLLVPTNYNPQTRQYTGIWDGTFKRAYTNNPAWIYYDLCTNDRYGLGNRLTPFMIDKWSLYRLAQYCDQSVSDGLGGQEPRFTCNVYIQNAEDAFSILMKLAGVFRAIAFWDGTSIICDADIPQDTYFTYTRANVVGGVFEYSGTRARDRHNVVKVAWDNPANHYKTEYEFVRDENAIAESGQVRILELDAWGCTSRGQAQRAGHWALKSEQKETRTVSFKVGLDGHIPLPGRVIEIADELFAGRANGGRVSKISADLKSITIDRDDVIAKAGDRLVINGENGKAQTRIVQSISGRVITVTLPFDENSIAVQNVWVLDAQDLATMKFRVISISQEEKHQFSITALQYNPQKFDEIDNGAFFEDAPISIINPSIQEPVKDVLITTESRVDQGINITTMIVSWMQAKGAVKYLVEWRKDDGSWIRLPQTGNNSVEVPGVYSGQYQARVTAISAFEIASLPVTSSLTEITGKQGLPPKIAFIRATGILFGMKLDWGFPPTGAKDTAYTEIEVSPDGINNIAQLGLFAYPTTTTTIQGLQPNLRQFYRGRLIDRIGNVGPWSEWVNGTTTADPEAVLDLISGHINESDLAQELQGKIENSVDVSEAAQAAANNAQAVASSAQTAANNAQAVASEAKTAASSAQSAATTAQTQASSAQKIANDASVIATNAKNTADQAAEDASSAITAAAEAKTTATNANTTATNAQTTANNASSAASKVASDLTTSTNQLNKKIADETDARTAAISKLNDGLTTETSQRKSEDAALLNNIETYKSSTNGTLSSLQTQINTNATNTSANTSKISSLDSRLTTNEGKTADAINAAATAQQTANTAVTNAAAAASAVTSLKSELSTGKGINNIIAPFSDPQELSPYIIGASRTVALVKSPMRIKGNAYDVTFNAVAGSIYFGSSSLATVNTAAAGVVSGGKRYMLSAYLKNLDATKQADVYFTLHWFKRAANGTFTASQSVLLNQATNNTRVTPSNDGGTISCKAVAAPPDAVAFAVICSGNGVYNVAGSRILIDMLMLEEVVGVDVPASTWTAGPTDLSAIKSALDANASAIQTTQTKVDNIDGRLTTATDSITSLNSRMSTAEGNINSTNTAVGGLSTRMATAEGKITNQSDSIASLQNSVTSINGTLANKADSSAVNNLTSRVETAEGKISSQSGQITSLSNSLDLTSSNLNDVNVLARLLSLGKPLRDDPTFKTTSAGGLSAYNFPAGTSWIKQAKSTDNPTGSTNEMLIKATQALGGGWYPTSPTLVLTANKTFLIKQIIKMPVGTKLQAIGNATGTGGYIRILGNDLGTGKFETYYSVVQGGADLSGSTIQGHFRVIAGTNPPVPTVDNPVFVILASYEVFDVTAVNDTIPKAYSDAIAANANAINTLSNTVTQQGNTITSQSNSITTLTNKITNNDLSNLVLNPDFVDPKSDWTSGVIVDATDAAPNPPSPKALRLNNRDSYYGPFVKCNVGDMFYVSAWFATPNTSATASAVLGFNTRNSAGTYTWYSVAIKSTDKNAWGMVEGYFTVPNGMVDIRPWLQVSIAASEAAGQQWHVTNIQVRNITGNKKLATDLQATSSALSTLDSKVTNIDGRVTSASNNIVSLNNSVTNINATLAQKADATALNSLSNRVTNAEGNITSQGNSITSLTNSLAVSGKGGTNLLIKSNVVGLYDGVSYPHHTYKLGEDWEIGAKYTLIWCAEHKRGTGDNNSYLAVYAGGGSQTLQSIVNTDGKVISKVTFVKNSAVASGPIIHFYMINRPTADKGTIGTVYWAVLVKGDVLTTDAWIPSPYDYIPDSNANAAAITNLTNTVTQQGNTLTSHTNSITSLDNSITSINGILNTKANTSAVSDLDSRVTDAEGKITANTSSITSLTANLKSTSNGITMSASIDVDPDSEWIYWTKNGEVARADDTTALGGKVYRFGNNAGNDHVNARSKAKLPFDQNKTYRIRARYRRVSGTGTVYCAVFGIAKDGVSHVNSSNTVTTDAGSSNYFVTNQAPALNAWQEVTVYVKGRAAGAATGGWTLDNPRQLPNATAFISVQFLANYSSAAGEVDLDYLIIEDADAIAANDATAKALSSLDTRVTTAEGKITSQGNSITQLNNSITTINGTLSTKADSSALTNLANRVTTAENSITSQGSSITSLNSSVTGILKDIEVTDTRSTNQPPSWYWSNYPKRIVREFKQASTIGLSGMGTYVSLETYVYYSDATGGPIIQIARGTDSKLTAERRSTSTSTWGTWVQDIKAISDGLANKAEASALSSLDSKVSVIDGKVSTQASSITTLQTTVGGNTASIQSQQQSIDGLKARATLKLQSGNLVGGVGIENDSKTVDFIIQANKFAIGAPSTVSGSVTPKYAFVYQSTATTLPNGTVIPAGLYLDSASISYINANKIYADSLSAISANLGTFTSLADQSKPNGARTVISGERIEVYDENNVMRVRIGRW